MLVNTKKSTKEEVRNKTKAYPKERPYLYIIRILLCVCFSWWKLEGGGGGVSVGV
jgi:hypothetical protein